MRHPICGSPDPSSIAWTTDSSSTLDRREVKPNGVFSRRVSTSGQSDRTELCGNAPHSSLGVGFHYYVGIVSSILPRP